MMRANNHQQAQDRMTTGSVRSCSWPRTADVTWTYSVWLPAGALTVVLRGVPVDPARVEPTRRPPLSRSGSRNTSTRAASGASICKTKLRGTWSPGCGDSISALSCPGLGAGGTLVRATVFDAGTTPRLGMTTCKVLRHVPCSGVCAANVSHVGPNGRPSSGTLTEKPAYLRSGLSKLVATSLRV